MIRENLFKDSCEIGESDYRAHYYYYFHLKKIFIVRDKV